MRKVARQVLAAVLAGLALAAAAVIISRHAHAQAKVGVPFDCEELATSMWHLADFRDTGARLELVVAMARRRAGDASLAHLAVIEREIRRLWREQLSAEDAAAALFNRCRAQLGDMGRDV